MGNKKEFKREVWVDWLRVVACFFVMMTHCCEPFYLGGEGSLILTLSDSIWVSVFNTLPRACVALFVIASSYLQFPLHYSAGEFFRKRAVRVLIPFVFWTLVYALVWGEPVENFKYEMIERYPLEDLELIIEFKKKRNSDKDKEAILKIE